MFGASLANPLKEHPSNPRLNNFGTLRVQYCSSELCNKVMNLKDVDLGASSLLIRATVFREAAT